MPKRKNSSEDPGPSSSKARVEEFGTCASLATRMRTLLLKEEGADVHFVVGDSEKGNVERIPAAVIILCAASDVFKTMFYGKFERPKEVDVPDGDPKAFKIVLRYIYTDKLRLNMDDAIGVLYLAKKYMLKPLVDGTTRYIADHLTPEDVCLFLDCANVFDDIKEKCWDLVDSKTTEVINSEAFLHLSAQQLFDIVKRNTLCVKEIELYERVIEWAQTQLRKDGVDQSPKAVRDVLGDTLFSIRFPMVGQKKFSSKVAKSGLLTADEALEVFLWYSIHDKPKSFICEARAHGRIRLKFDLRALADGSLATPHNSAKQKIGDAAWSISAQRRACPQIPNTYGLGLYLRCHGVAGDPQWRRPVYALLRVVAQAPGVDDLSRTIGHTFTASQFDWGYVQFATFDALLDANTGVLIENKDVELVVDVFAKDCAPPSIGTLCAAHRFD